MKQRLSSLLLLHTSLLDLAERKLGLFFHSGWIFVNCPLARQFFLAGAQEGGVGGMAGQSYGAGIGKVRFR
ncbi:hypothetical protein [Cypionkella aquatica]|uniref:hypothetical protein n=1 Tax=Cypionkella aquatica TaxID=1756042 RepID=UPI0024E0EE87|nr:hypothetical protein [Cypionkella aquatica]